ncbi:Poly [ADP-ribose] polymerase 12 [Nibea albiflora]|uniref:Poly [ADP-ribose] polymerase 12 n=1 Tax=Nibea albiflora TaxID=240163 RepID=A0ACB7FDE6_NIBAL|nr:Poly [ADP-ribose] polymerase 12 [Nibea albiflora]
MAAAISKLITKTLCDNQGCLDFKRLDQRITKSFTVAEQVLRSVLFDDGRIAIQEGRQRAVGSQIISPDSLIVAKTSLRLCQKKPGECPQCDALHLCRYYVCGDCTFGHKCKNSHSVACTYNAEILTRYGLHELTEKQLFQLLLQNDPYLLPEICPHYNKGNGLHGSCRFTTNCTKLHICHHYVQGDCKFGSSCKRSHNVDAQGLKIFKGFSQENITNILQIYRNKFIIMGQQKRHAVPEKCARVHWHLPYRWQVLDSDGVTWKDMPDMEDIEKAYCDPRHDTSSTGPTSAHLRAFQISVFSKSVDFRTMTYAGSPVRRLSTVSSVSKPPHFILTTQWLWYWKDDMGTWVEFGQGDGDAHASVTSPTLENVYLADRDTEVPFGAGKQQYILHFKGALGTPQMYQENVKYKTRREVRRRPRFVSAHDVEAKLKSVSSPSSSLSTAESFPSHWDKNALPDFGYKLIPLSKSGKEYNMIDTLFKRTMPKHKISNIQRIQNPSLWEVFQWQKEHMKKRDGGKAVNQQYLFHGTDHALIEAICEQNFDWRMCGVHGTAYGKGSYFARDASYSDRYSSIKHSLNKVMFVALVLVGDYTKGRSSYLRPPPKGNSNTLHDSCVDSESNPGIYVVFEKQQIYPEYLISYS